MKKNKSFNMTEGGILKPLIFFMLPLIGSSLFQQLYNTVDFLFVGNLLGKTSAAAVGASSTLITCLIGIFTGVSLGTGVVTSHAVGAGDDDRADRTLHTSVVFGLYASALITIAGILLTPHILALLHTPASAIPEAVLYMRIYVLSLPAMVFYNVGSGVLRALGDSDTPFRIMVLCGFVNVAADYLLVAVIPAGVAGVGIATVISQTCSALLCAASLCKPGRPVRLSREKLFADIPLLKQILSIGIPAGTQSVVITASNVVVQYYINGFGETAVAAFATYYKTENLIYLPIMAFGQAATTFSGQNFGAKKMQRIQKGAWVVSAAGALTTACIAALILVFSRTVFSWFMKDADVVSDALKIARVTFPFYWIYPIMEVLGGTIRGTGNSFRPMVIVIGNLCVLRILLLAVFSSVFRTLESVAAVYPLTWAAAAVSFAIAFFVTFRQAYAPNE